MRERKRDRGRLEDIIRSIDNVRQYILDVTYETFVDDTMRYYAVMKNVEIIGEAANMLTRSFRKSHNELPWRMIVSMRNVLTHGYANVSALKLWKTATTRIGMNGNKVPTSTLKSTMMRISRLLKQLNA